LFGLAPFVLLKLAWAGAQVVFAWTAETVNLKLMRYYMMKLSTVAALTIVSLAAVTANVQAADQKGMSGMEGQKGMSGMQGMEGQKGMSGMQGMEGQKGMSGMQGMEGQKGMSGMQGMEGKKK
jgi:hypothetical protein